MAFLSHIAQTTTCTRVIKTRKSIFSYRRWLLEQTSLNPHEYFYFPTESKVQNFVTVLLFIPSQSRPENRKKYFLIVCEWRRITEPSYIKTLHTSSFDGTKRCGLRCNRILPGNRQTFVNHLSTDLHKMTYITVSFDYAFIEIIESFRSVRSPAILCVWNVLKQFFPILNVKEMNAFSMPEMNSKIQFTIFFSKREDYTCLQWRFMAVEMENLFHSNDTVDSEMGTLEHLLLVIQFNFCCEFRQNVYKNSYSNRKVHQSKKKI